MTAALQPVDKVDEQLSREGEALIAAANALQVADDATEQEAADFRGAIQASIAGVEKFFKSMKSKAYDAWKEVCGKEKAQLDPRQSALDTINKKLGAYRIEKERVAAAERRRLEEAARKLEEDQRLEEAAAAENAGDHQTAHEIIERPVQIAPPPVAITKPKGVSYRSVWKHQVVSLIKLIVYVAAHPELANWLKANETAIRAAVTSQKSGFNVPGVRVWEEKELATNNRR